MTIAHFTVVYDGEALLTNRMDVRDLGPALMSLGQLFDEANRVLNDNKTEIRLNFKTPVLEEQVILQDTRQIAYSIVSLSFREDNKWRLFDGSNTIHAALKDEAFLHKVEAGLISFTKSDMLICEVNITQKDTQAGLKMDYEIVKVLEHKTSPKQLSLDIEPEERA